MAQKGTKNTNFGEGFYFILHISIHKTLSW